EAPNPQSVWPREIVDVPRMANDIVLENEPQRRIERPACDVHTDEIVPPIVGVVDAEARRSPCWCASRIALRAGETEQYEVLPSNEEGHVEVHATGETGSPLSRPRTSREHGAHEPGGEDVAARARDKVPRVLAPAGSYGEHPD